jgi:hypothetical protein
MVLEKALASCTTFMELEMGFTFATVFLFKEKKNNKKKHARCVDYEYIKPFSFCHLKFHDGCPASCY